VFDAEEMVQPDEFNAPRGRADDWMAYAAIMRDTAAAV
jgi:hypothetical protein